MGRYSLMAHLTVVYCYHCPLQNEILPVIAKKYLPSSDLNKQYIKTVINVHSHACILTVQ